MSNVNKRPADFTYAIPDNVSVQDKRQRTQKDHLQEIATQIKGCTDVLSKALCDQQKTIAELQQTIIDKDKSHADEMARQKKVLEGVSTVMKNFHTDKLALEGEVTELKTRLEQVQGQKLAAEARVRQLEAMLAQPEEVGPGRTYSTWSDWFVYFTGRR